MEITPETLIALAALIVSLVALFRGENLQKSLQTAQSERDALQSNVSMLVDVWGKLGSKPSLLRFHGVTEEKLKAVGIDADDLAYLVASFESAGYYYEYIDKEVGAFPRDSLRYRMCESTDTQKAWPLLRDFFKGTPKYLARIDATINLLKKE